jgi:3-deoxy-D-manno-octulosonate 8-phosphate phosphatase (KDO 8-P phosphatase)
MSRVSNGNTAVERIMDNDKPGSVTHVIVDVDGTMTDGGIYYDNHGNEVKKFNTRDAAGFFAAKAAGLKTIVLTGRECEATARRMRELEVDIVQQGVHSKAEWLQAFAQEHSLRQENLAYIGDDLNDLPPMNLCNFVACPADACDEVKAIAGYVSGKNGGCGAVRDCLEHMLRQRGEWDAAMMRFTNVAGK